MKKQALLVMFVVAGLALAQTAKSGAAAGGKKSAPAAGSDMKAEDHHVWMPDQLSWGAAPDILPSGAQLAVLEGDPTKPGEFTMRLKMPDGYKIPPHFHARVEHVTVVSGTFKVGMGDKWDDSKMGEIGPGVFAWIKPGTRHFAAAKGETVIQLHGEGPWSLTYVNPQDDPRKQAAK